jgi:DNA-binding transcriptional LysR family regulator
MPIMRIESSELRAFIAVITHNGFNRAAENLHLTQSAVSQSIANLEAKLGASLIRRGKQLKLTDEGKRLYEYAHQALREEQQTLEDISNIKNGDNAILSLALNSTINRFYAPQLLDMYCRQYPHYRLKIEELPSRSIIYAVLSGSTELGMGPLQKHMSAHDTIPLYQETRFLVVSPKHPLCDKIIAGDEKALKQTALIDSFLDDAEMRPAIQRIRDRFSAVWEISSLSLRIHLVAQGLGVAYIDRKLLEEHTRCKDFQHIRDETIGRFDRQVGIYHKSGKKLSQCAEHFVTLCRDFWQVDAAIQATQKNAT